MNCGGASLPPPYYEQERKTGIIHAKAYTPRKLKEAVGRLGKVTFSAMAMALSDPEKSDLPTTGWGFVWQCKDMCSLESVVVEELFRRTKANVTVDISHKTVKSCVVFNFFLEGKCFSSTRASWKENGDILPIKSRASEGVIAIVRKVHEFAKLKGGWTCEQCVGNSINDGCTTLEHKQYVYYTVFLNGEEALMIDLC